MQCIRACFLRFFRCVNLSALQARQTTFPELPPGKRHHHLLDPICTTRAKCVGETDKLSTFHLATVMLSPEMASASKRGLCWPTDNVDAAFTFTKPGSKISWLYNWSPQPTPDARSLDFVPMQWNHVDIDNLPTKVRNCHATAVLGFNEPELPDQSNLTSALAAREWIRCFEPLRRAGIRCGSPGISSAPQGVVWLQDFLRQIRAGGSDVDFYCLHWYGETLGQFYDYIWST